MTHDCDANGEIVGMDAWPTVWGYLTIVLHKCRICGDEWETSALKEETDVWESTTLEVTE